MFLNRMLWMAPILWAVCTIGAAQQIEYRQYLRADGLLNLTVDCMIQDHAKYIWVCTDNGLFRYDGARFEHFGPDAGIGHARIYAIAGDSQDRIWLGNTKHLYVGKEGRFTELFDRGSSMEIGVGAKLAVDHDRMLAIAAQHLYAISSDAGANWRIDSVFSTDELRNNPSLETLSAVYVDPAGVIWLGCGSRICRVAAGQIQTWDIDAGAREVWQSFLLDSRGQLWARSFNHIAVLPMGAGKFEYRDAPLARLTTAQPFVQMVEDHDGRIVSRTDEGVLRWSTDISRRTSWERFGGGNGLPSTYMLSLLVDHEGSLWLGTNGNGLLRWQGYENWESWTTLQGLKSNTIWSILRDANQRLLVGTGAGCSMLNEATKRFAPCAFKGATALRELNAMVQTPDRSLWLTTMSGELWRIDANDVAHHFATLPYVRFAKKDTQGNLWLMTYRGVYRVLAQGGPGAPELMNIPGAETGDFSDATEETGGGMWFASTRGLYKYADDQWTEAPVFGEQARSGYRSLALDEHGQAWAAGNYRGVLKSKMAHGSMQDGTWLTDSLLADTAVSTVREDNRGLVWLGTDSGLLMFDGKQWRRFTQADGLIWNDISQTSFFLDTDASIWVGTSAGLSHIVHPERMLHSGPLDLRIVRADSGSSRLDTRGDSSVRWRKNLPLDLQFAVADFAKADGLVYRYRLVGLESDWSATRVPMLRYSSLEPGHYRLEVIALNPELGLSSPLVSTSFTVIPPWWRTAWAQCLFAACAGLGLALLWRWRNRRLVALQRSLQRDLREREALLQRATRDALTGLWNRAAILDLLAQEMSAATQHQSPLALAIIDVDNFKQVNDSRGHLAGDHVLRTLGAHLRKVIRSSDHIGRYGGEELLLLMPGLPVGSACAKLEQLRASIAGMNLKYEHANFSVTASIGVASFQPERDSAELLISRADSALYSAKKAGRNRIQFCSIDEGQPSAAA